MLNESSPSERSIAQGLGSLSSSIGQLMGSALVGAVAASHPNALGGSNYASAFLVISIIGAVLVVLAFGLKPRLQEQPAAIPALKTQA
jgi:MFS family permease